jgi:hypothetical protein
VLGEHAAPVVAHEADELGAAGLDAAEDHEDATSGAPASRSGGGAGAKPAQRITGSGG